MPAKAAAPISMATMASAGVPCGSHPSANAAITMTTVWITSSTTTIAILAETHRVRPRGVAPRRFNTLYCRSKPVPMPRLTIALDMTARARIPGVRKFTALSTSSGRGRTFTVEKNTSSSSGMAILTRSCSPLRRLRTSSVRV
jgi:hypothetical protein